MHRKVDSATNPSRIPRRLRSAWASSYRTSNLSSKPKQHSVKAAVWTGTDSAEWNASRPGAASARSIRSHARAKLSVLVASSAR